MVPRATLQRFGDLGHVMSPGLIPRPRPRAIWAGESGAIWQVLLV